MGKFIKDTSHTFITQIIAFALGVGAMIIIARVLGPEKNGIYTLCILVATLVVNFGNLGIDSATIYNIGKKRYDFKEIFRNNFILVSFISILAVLVGLALVIIFHDIFLEEVPYYYLFLALLLIPVTLIMDYLGNVLRGLQEIIKFNLAFLGNRLFLFLLVLMALFLFRLEVIGALTAHIFAGIFIAILIYRYLKKIKGKLFEKYRITRDYVKETFSYGLKNHIANILGFLNYRVDILLINMFLNPLAVGYYAVSVGIVERLWMISNSACTALFPRVCSEEDEKSLKEFTPVVSRNVFLITAIGAVILYFLSHWLVIIFFSEVYLNSIRPLQILLPGIVALSTARIFGNDLAGRGKPILNVYIGTAVVFINIILNIILIPKWGISGAALASTVAYITSLIGSSIIYSRISGNSILKCIFIQRSDFKFYKDFYQILKSK